MSSIPTVSVIVPCRNERDYIEKSVRSILAQEAPPGGFEVIVADAMSDDGTREVLKRLSEEDSRLHVVDDSERIVPAGLNSAIRAAHGKIIVRMDAHTDYASDYVRQCFEVLHETGADNVGGPWIAEGKGFIGRAIAAAFQSAFAVGGALGHRSDYEGQLDTVYLGCWPIEVFEQIGLFDEELVRSEDDEFNLRLTRAGGKIWQSPRIKSWYHPRASLAGLWRQYMQYGYWKVRVIQKHKIPASWRHLVPGGFLFSLFLLAVLAMWWPVAGWSLTVLVSLYFCFVIGASLLTAARQSWRILPLLPLVFGCYHF